MPRTPTSQANESSSLPSRRKVTRSFGPACSLLCIEKTKPADALKAILITYLRFGTGNPARYRLMFGPELQGQDAGLPSEVIHAFASVEAVYRGVLKRGSEDRTFKIPPNDPAALEVAVIAFWSLIHGLTMLYIDGLATLETAQTIDSLADKIVAIFMYGLVKREKRDYER